MPVTGTQSLPPTLRPSSPTPMLTPMLGVGVSPATTVRPTAPDVLGPGDGETEGLCDGALLPDALGVGSTVGPGDEDADGGSPTVGVTATSTILGDGPPCTPTAPGLGDADEDADGPGDGVVPGSAGDDTVAVGWPPPASGSTRPVALRL